MVPLILLNSRVMERFSSDDGLQTTVEHHKNILRDSIVMEQGIQALPSDDDLIIKLPVSYFRVMVRLSSDDGLLHIAELHKKIYLD